MTRPKRFGVFTIPLILLAVLGGLSCDKEKRCNDQAPVPLCGDGVVEPPEVCEAGWSRACGQGSYASTEQCQPDCSSWGECEPVESCGDGAVNGDEVCDGGLETCETALGHRGTRGCAPDCGSWNACESMERCGDGAVNGSEACDGGFQECQTPLGHWGAQACAPDCKSWGECQSEEHCGDGIVTGYEECDGNSQVCSVGGYFGAAPCIQDHCLAFGECVLTQFCGDGKRNGPEACDGGDLVLCNLPGNYKGRALCGEDCELAGECEPIEYCGDGVLNGLETCDGASAPEGSLCHADCQGFDCLPGHQEDSHWGCYKKEALPAFAADDSLKCRDGVLRFDVADSDLVLDMCSGGGGATSRYVVISMHKDDPVQPPDDVRFVTYANRGYERPYWVQMTVVGFLERQGVGGSNSVLREFLIYDLALDLPASTSTKRFADGVIRLDGATLEIADLAIYWDETQSFPTTRYRPIRAEYVGVINPAAEAAPPPAP